MYTTVFLFHYEYADMKNYNQICFNDKKPPTN